MERDFHNYRGSTGKAGASWELASFRTGALLFACAAVVAGCGGSDDQPSAAPAVGVAPPQQPPPAPPTQTVQARCAMDTSVAASYEEQRLVNKLNASDAQSFSQRLLQASGFDKFGPEFALKLCKDGMAGASSHDEAVTLIKAEGQKLWQAAVDRVQGRKVEGTLPKSDDRMLYWARLTMTHALRQWKPDFALSDEQRAALHKEFERASRGQYAIDFPDGAGHKRILVSGFDPFTLGAPGFDGNPNIRIGNPSGATILSLDGHTVALADGTTAVIRTFVLPVNYGPFMDGMQEDTLGPWFKPGAKRVDASITVSQGGGSFALEHFNSRYHYVAPGNDNISPSCAGGYPAADDCDIHPPQRWLGYASKPWKKDMPPQFTQASLPFQKMIDANTGADIVNPGTGKKGGWSVARNDNYSMIACTKAAADLQGPYEAARLAAENALAAWRDAGYPFPGPLYEQYEAANAARSSVPAPAPTELNCALQGGGGTYLSNASAYRNTLMRDLFGLSIPAGHIHTPAMTQFGSGSNDLITDATFEARRDAIVAQTRNLVAAVANSLAAPGPTSP
ncbi:hypothetical protein P3W85_40395 [Cupriavidus basilensis]|uniref:Uncharacterized protein n=1 Tax=Cupriavidus basilensis TaxID=68895 RepID=A0ABT6B352_9BURK|nr:hypothetical protein [Cupriavidus basilensis]MDF3839154.1 hypothetical protein [Cupriavidus basilensis]